MTDEQAVVTQPDEQAAPVSEGSNAQDLDLDALLQEYSKPGEPEKTPEKITELDKQTLAEKLQKIDKIEEILTQTQKAEAQKIADQRFNETVKSVKGDLKIPDIFVKGFLEMKARENPNLVEAYSSKDKTPEQWAKVEKKLNSEMKKLLSEIPDKGATEIMNQVDSAVRNAKTTSPDIKPQNLSKMTNSEFEREKSKIFKQIKTF
jgi:hypothetical protein